MTSERRVMELFERANPIPDPDTYIVEPDPDRIMQTDHDPTITIDATSEHPPTHRRRWLLPAIAAAAVAVIVVAGLIVFARNDDAQVPADTPAPVTTVPPSSTTADESEELGAADVVAGFFEAFNSGDVDAILALMSDDVVVTENLGGLSADDAAPVTDVERHIAWRLGRGETVENPSCTTAAPAPDAATSVECEYDTVEALAQAVLGAPVPTRTRFTVVDDEVSEITTNYGPIVPEVTSRSYLRSILESAFRGWIFGSHPDMWNSLFDEWTSRSDAAEQGRLQAEWAQRWADDREGCGDNLMAPCGPVVDQPDIDPDVARRWWDDLRADGWSPADRVPELGWINEACPPGPADAFEYFGWQFGSTSVVADAPDPGGPQLTAVAPNTMSVAQAEAVVQMIMRLGACDLPDAFPDASPPVSVEEIPPSVPARGFIVNDEYALFAVTNPGGGLVTMWLSEGNVTLDLVTELATIANQRLDEAVNTDQPDN